ncbi:hypothetical protein FRB90_006884 [Tulasnella sp. 427]|nr:hypothetical protein FRB90_006884 [Tulasnella sp. 427]
MDAQVKRKIVPQADSTTTTSSNYLRSSTNIVTNATTTAVKTRAKITVNTNTFASKNDAPLSSQPRARSKSPVRMPPPRSSSTVVRSPSPIRITAKSSPVTRVTSPDFQQKLKSSMPPGSSATITIPRTRSTIGGPTSANPVPSSSSSSPRFTSASARVTSPTPTLRAVASTHSLPGSPRLRPTSMIVNGTGGATVTAGSSLRPTSKVNSPRNHLRNNSISDTSTLSTHSPASSSVGTGPFDGGPVGSPSPDAVPGPPKARSPSPVGSQQSASSPPIRVKSKVSSLAVKALGVNGNNNTGPPSPSVPSTFTAQQRKVSVTSAGGRGGTTTPRQRSPSISSAVSSPPISQTRPASRAKANIHFNTYQPFPVPPLPAPPPPEAIEGLLNRSPPGSPRLGFQKSPPVSPPPFSATFPRQQKSGSPPSFAKATPDQFVGSPSSVTTAREIHAILDKGMGDPEKLGSPIAEDGMQDIQAEARTNRKIEDLEITNRSLLAINTMLEATKARQAKEIRELKRKLRETRLTLPPKTYAALRSSEANSSMDNLPAAVNGDTSGATESVSSDEDEVDDDAEPQPDPMFDRVSHMIEAMLSHASEAVKQGKEPIVLEERMVKVLSAAEVESYHRSGSDREGTAHDHDPDEVESLAPTDSEADGDMSFSVDDSFTSIDPDSVAPSHITPLSPFPPLLTITSDSPISTRPIRGLPSPLRP